MRGSTRVLRAGIYGHRLTHLRRRAAVGYKGKPRQPRPAGLSTALMPVFT